MGRVTASEASQSPPHRHILRRARTQVRAFFSHVAPAGGMRIPDRGSTTGAATWTDREPASGLPPQGRAKRVNPPLTAIFEMRACTQVRALFFYILRWGDAPREKRIPKLILLHSLILFAEVIHQRSNGGQQPAPGGKYRMDHFPPRLPLIQYHL